MSSPVEQLAEHLLSESTNSRLVMPSKNQQTNKSFSAKWQEDKLGISVLMLLYCLQGIPLGLIFGSLPFVMAERLSYTDQATFSLAAYPYSLKLFWSPIVDVIYNSKFGRRKSWIFPTQLLMGLTMIYISRHFNDWSGGNTPQVNILTYWFFWLIFLTATQDIAVDGWALTILSAKNRELQAMCQTVGQTFGYAIGFPVFLALNSSEICIKWFGTQKEIVTPASFLGLCGVIILITNILMTLFINERKPTKAEENELNKLSIQSTYIDILRVIRIPNVFKLIIILLTCRIAFCCVDSVTSLKLNEKGFPKETAGLLVFIYVPFELIFPFIIAYINSYLDWSKMKLWQNGFRLRILISLSIVLLVYVFEIDENGNVSYSFILKQIFIAICYSFTSSVMFTAQCAFFAKIADETIGGTYLTLLNTAANLGNTWPRYPVLRSIDLFTVKNQIPCININDDNKPCFEIKVDGYYYVAAICAMFGVIWIIYCRITLNSFDNIPKQSWTVQRSKVDID
eukprot:432963_1